MSEVLNTFTTIGTAGGYTIGQILEQTARQVFYGNRAALFGVHRGDSRILERQGIARLASVLALMGAADGYALGQTLEPNPIQSGPAVVLNEDVDHSYSTGADGTFSLINSTAQYISSNPHFRTSITDLNKTNFSPTSANKLPYDIPIGQPYMDKAVRAGITSVLNDSKYSTSTSSTLAPEAIILAITDGHSIGSLKDVSNQANQQPGTRVRVYIDNVNPNIDSSTLRTLKAITKATDGQLFNSAKPQTISSAITRDSNPNPTQEMPVDKSGWIAMTTLLGAITARAFWRRKSETAAS